MAWVQTFLDFVKNIAWPLVVLTLAFCFRRDLHYLATRVTIAGPAGVEFNPQRQLTIPPLSPGELKELPGLARTKIMGELEAELHKQLQLFDADKRLDLTVHYLAQSRLEQLFEWIYGQIFGSQIAALRSLMAAPGGQMTLADVISYFDNVKSNEGAPYQNVSFDQWSAFLRNQQLIRVVGDRVEITDLGRDFLLFLSARGRPENKPL
jgi:hypothetical protein